MHRQFRSAKDHSRKAGVEAHSYVGIDFTVESFDHFWPSSHTLDPRLDAGHTGVVTNHRPCHIIQFVFRCDPGCNPLRRLPSKACLDSFQIFGCPAGFLRAKRTARGRQYETGMAQWQSSIADGSISMEREHNQPLPRIGSDVESGLCRWLSYWI